MITVGTRKPIFTDAAVAKPAAQNIAMSHAATARRRPQTTV